MTNYKLGCDVHKKYSQFSVMDEEGQVRQRDRLIHSPEALREYLSQFPEGTPVAFETVGNWYWVAEAIEAAGCLPQMAHAAKAKVMMGNVNKTDKLDADGLATLLYLGKLPTVWIPDKELRDERELLRTRMAFSHLRTALKNRIHATLSKYALSVEVSDLFGKEGREQLEQLQQKLPEQTRLCLERELEVLDDLQVQIDRMENTIHERLRQTHAMQLLKTLPGFGEILSSLVSNETGSVDRFPNAEHFASYAGLVPKVSSSGGKSHYGHMRQESNHYLKWAFIEAANVVVRCQNHPAWQNKHAVKLYISTQKRRGHAVAVGAVARHLAEAAYWMLRKEQVYREPASHLPKQA